MLASTAGRQRCTRWRTGVGAHSGSRPMRTTTSTTGPCWSTCLAFGSAHGGNAGTTEVAFDKDLRRGPSERREGTSTASNVKLSAHVPQLPSVKQVAVGGDPLSGARGGRDLAQTDKQTCRLAIACAVHVALQQISQMLTQPRHQNALEVACTNHFVYKLTHKHGERRIAEEYAGKGNAVAKRQSALTRNQTIRAR